MCMIGAGRLQLAWPQPEWGGSAACFTCLQGQLRALLLATSGATGSCLLQAVVCAVAMLTASCLQTYNAQAQMLGRQNVALYLLRCIVIYIVACKTFLSL